MKIQRKRSNKIMASVSGKIPYELVSTLTVLRDYADVDDAYVSDEHKKLVDIADSIYNADIDPESMYDEYKSLYKKYGKSYFDKVLKDIRAIDSQISSSNVRDLADEYEGRVAEFGGEVESACGKRPIKSSTQGGDMLSVVELNRQAYINQWKREYEGEPSTSWDNIFDRLVAEFYEYADDELSADIDESTGWFGDTLATKYAEGEISADDIDAAFSDWVFWQDLSDYDV